MPCTEMKELMASSNKYAATTNALDTPRAAEARVAYTMQMHRLSCGLCRRADLSI